MATKTCSFCAIQLNRKNRANEHVIPKWLLDLLEIKREEKHIGSRKLPDGEILTERSFGARDIKYGLICKACNNGWLSDLETTTHSIFSRLFEMRPLSLDKIECSNLAFWGYKTAVLLALTADQERNQLIRSNLLSDLYQARILPKTAHISLLLAIPAPKRKAETIIHQPEFIDQRPLSISREQFSRLATESLGYVVMLQFGHIVLRVIDIEPRRRWKLLDINMVPHISLSEGNGDTNLKWPPAVWLEKTLYDLASSVKFSLRET
jgi:hypothetical protein